MGPALRRVISGLSPATRRGLAIGAAALVGLLIVIAGFAAFADIEQGGPSPAAGYQFHTPKNLEAGSAERAWVVVRPWPETAAATAPPVPVPDALRVDLIVLEGTISVQAQGSEERTVGNRAEWNFRLEAPPDASGEGRLQFVVFDVSDGMPALELMRRTHSVTLTRPNRSLIERIRDAVDDPLIGPLYNWMAVALAGFFIGGGVLWIFNKRGPE